MTDLNYNMRVSWLLVYPTPLILKLTTRLFSLNIHFCIFFLPEFNNLGPLDNGATKLQVVQSLVFFVQMF